MHTISGLAIVVWLLAATSASARYPVVLVPGDGGSRIDAKLNKPSVVHYLCDKKTSDYSNIWLNLELLVPYVIDCLIDNMRLMYDNVTRTTHSPPGVDIRVPGWGNSSAVEYIDPSLSTFGAYFKSVGDTLVGTGLERDVSIRGAPYDFRKAPNENTEFFVKLKILTEETYQQNNNTPIVFIVHSMGGCMTLKFLRAQTQEWKDKYVRAMVSLAGAWGGAVKALKVFAVGDDLGVYVLSGNVLKAEQITSPSLAWLLPSPYFWKADEVLVETDKKNYTVTDYKSFFEGIDYMTGYDMYLDVKQYMDFGPPGVEVHCLHGDTIPTVERMIFGPGKFPLKYPKLQYGNGDGTVNSRSLEGCSYWSTMQKQKVFHQVFPNADHMTILRDERVMDYISQLMEKL
ncbi:group XV phospholipase A2-like isoform X1 [Myzus persicae]|uniref:group XV phospholipase A2-like isoform X1 n=2 Tax=Myzus persicae TaxID=13164 RepID=UPI000B9334B4|nr:group XV phospholipase A2-like isoform X1 [Myzus persicae]XP_022160152.1 group XV phospholipase A2-like isoform X1 [Myzus persicae]XP_022160153.1 group XV phospholipase A2-like isoform X1 [Myzus persicae]